MDYYWNPDDTTSGRTNGYNGYNGYNNTATSSSLTTDAITSATIPALTPSSKIKFYHTPKAGGTSVFNMTQRWPNFKRAHPRQNHVQIKWHPPQRDETALTIVRHPYTRFESAFYHMVDACDDRFYYRHATVSDCETMKKKAIHFQVFREDPNEFLSAIIESNHPYHHEADVVFRTFSIFRPQFYWLSNLWGTKLHDQLKIILRQENLEHEFTEVARRIGQLPQWPTDTESNRRLTNTNNKPLTERSKAILQQLYADDFRHFGFSP